MNSIKYINPEGDELTEQELQTRFAEYMNDALPLVEIGELVFLAGDALKVLDPTAYNEEFWQYVITYEWEEVEA